MSPTWMAIRIGATLFPFVLAEIVILAMVKPLLEEAIVEYTNKTEEEP
ncbi:hypothetical protein [Haloplanus halophilus]|nr:hypothetical protein [Haloplanus sp. GDY1]